LPAGCPGIRSIMRIGRSSATNERDRMVNLVALAV
jgi:hypothetical protein